MNTGHKGPCCPNCKGLGEVIDSRTHDGVRSKLGGHDPVLTVPYRRRRYSCLNCGDRWSTVEVAMTDLVRT
jgi:transcriptional regulator NrdR family protein